MEILSVGPQEMLFWHFGDTNASLLGDNIHEVDLLGKSLKMSKKYFLMKFLKVKKQTSYTLLLDIGSLLIETMAIESVVEYIHA